MARNRNKKPKHPGVQKMNELMRFRVTVLKEDGQTETHERVTVWSIQWFAVLSLTMDDGRVELYPPGTWKHAGVVAIAYGSTVAPQDRPSQLVPHL